MGNKLKFAAAMAIISGVLLLAAGHTTGKLNPLGSFDGEKAYHQVLVLADRIGPRPPGSSAEKAAGDYIASQLRSFGWQVSAQEFSQATVQDQGNLKNYS